LAKWYKKLKKAREAMGLSLQGAVNLLHESHKIKMHRVNLYKLEQGNTEIPVSKFRALCDIYSVSADWILDLKE
jgi:transcriptional regulator with XRE-family HTH domain